MATIRDERRRRDSAIVDRFLTSLRKAGLPE
jgi:hypothetical protein